MRLKLPLFKISIFFLVLCCGGITPLRAQFAPRDSANVLQTPFGMTVIGNQPYIGFRIQPEIAFKKFGVGLDIPLMFSVQDGSFRSQEFEDGAGVLRMIRYFRYGVKKRDKYYVRVGDLTGSYLGYGGLMNNYTNSPSFERRQVGVTFDVNPIPEFGIEGTYSSFNNGFNLLALRPYTRPLIKTDIPVIKTLEIGASVVTDYTRQQIGQNGQLQDTRFVKDGMNSLGADMGVVVIDKPAIRINAFAQFSHMLRNRSLADSVDRYRAAAALDPTLPITNALANGYKAASGFSVGTQLRVNVLANVLSLEVRLERLWYQEHFLPQFYDAVYEINKDAKMWVLANAAGTAGTYGALQANIINKIFLIGGLQVPDNISIQTPAFVFVNLVANDLLPGFIINGSYVKGRLSTLGDAFTFDERSLANLRIAYKITKFLMAGVDYRWTFAQVEENGAQRFKPVSFVMPYVGLNLPLNFMNRNQNIEVNPKQK
jgi:hypothetical protein